MRNYILIPLTCLLTFSIHFLQAQFITHHSPVFQGYIPIKPAGTVFTDKKFSAPVLRLTDARSDTINGYFPDYSKRQAWNSDETLMMIRSGDGSVHIFDGQTYQYIKSLTDIQGVQDIFWHPARDSVYYILDNVFYIMNVQTLAITPLHTFGNYPYVSARGEGNMTNDAHFIALCGYDTLFNPVDFLVYDTWADSVRSTLPVTGNVLFIDWLSMSPLGNYVIVNYATDVDTAYNGIEVYDLDFNLLWRKPLGAGHSDCGLDANGDEVLIMDVYNPDSNLTYINKYVLATGAATSLLAVAPDFDLHESCRAMSRPGWVYISTFDFVGRLTDDSLGWLPFEDEIFALRMDGSGDVQRYAHHHSRRYSPSTPNSDSSVYFAEPHATVNKTGSRILFGSNWRAGVEQDTSVDAYIVDLRQWLAVEDNQAALTGRNDFEVYPNPAAENLNIAFGITGDRTVNIFNIMGESVRKISSSGALITIGLSGLPQGMYCYHITEGEALVQSGKVIKQR